MATQQHILNVNNSYIIRQVENRTFKFGKAHDNGQADKLVNNIKLTDLPYERNMVYQFIDVAVGNIRSAFVKYASGNITEGYETGHDNENDYKTYAVTFNLSSKWDSGNGAGFDNDCNEYVINKVVSDFLSLSLPKEANVYAVKAMQALKDAERKLYYKTA